MHISTEAFSCAKSKHLAWITLLSSVSWNGNVDKRKAPCWNCFIYIFWQLLPCGPNSQNLTPSSHCYLTRQPPCFACPLQLPTFCLHAVWCMMHRHASRSQRWNSKTFHNCMKVLSQFRIPYCTNLRQYSKKPKRGGAHDNAQIPSLQFSLPTSAPEKCVRLLTLQPSVAMATGRKTCFPQIVLLQYKAKPYLDFQNLGCNCKILGCHFDTPKRLKKALHLPCVFEIVFHGR